MNKKVIWIVSISAQLPENDTHLRHYKFADFLAKHGYEPYIFIGSYFHYLQKNIRQKGKLFEEKIYGNIHYIILRMPSYNGNLKRIWAIEYFAWSLFLHRKKFPYPNILLHNMHAPLDVIISLCAKRLHSRYIAEQWDLWPDDFVQDGLISARNPIMKWAYAQERKMYERASDIIYTFAGGVDYLKKQKWTNSTGGKIDEKHVHYINNGICLDDFDKNKELYVLNDIDLENSDDFKLVYLGAIKFANNLKLLIDAVSLLQVYKNIKLYIYGKGEQRDKLVCYCNENHIRNIIFKEEWIPIKYVPYVVSHADVNILNYHQKFSSYGISSGKLFQYLAAGKPLICNVNIDYDDIITDNDLGFARWFDTPQQYADAILKIYNMDKNSYNLMCKRVRNVSRTFDYDVLSKQLLKIIAVD